LRKALLRDADVAPVEPVRMRQADRRPRLLGRRPARRLAHHLFRSLVLAQAAEGSMADDAVGRPGPELDLGDQLRPDEDHLACLVGRELPGKWALRLLQLLQLPEQALGHLLAEAGSDAPRRNQLAALVVAEQQRADLLAGDRRGGEAGDHELLPLGALGLDPIPAPPRA